MLFKIKYLESLATPKKTFNIINSYFQRRNIASNGCIEIRTDVVSRINKVIHPDLITSHCFLNRIFIGYKLLCVKHVLVLDQNS